MIKSCFLWLGLCLSVPSLFGSEVLIVADEFPAMEYLASRLQAEEHLTAEVVSQDKMPERLSDYRAVIVYLHHGLNPGPERAMIAYTRAGGRLVALHHSISSGKRKNQEWFPFLGVKLPEGDVEAGGYKWIEGIRFSIVNLAPKHFITTHKVRFPDRIQYTPSDVPDGPAQRPGLVLDESEVYLNHTHTKARTLLLGLKYTDPKTGKVWMQDRAGWLRPAGRGLIVYFMPGHSLRDFKHPTYTRMILNAVIFQP